MDDFTRTSALAPNPWDRGAAEREGRRMFPSGTLKMVAAALAGSHPRALDYLRQAPVIVLAAAAGRAHRQNTRRVRTAIHEAFGARCRAGHRLRDVMVAYGCAPGLRALKPRALTLSRWVVIHRLGKLPPQRLAPLIPAEARDQEAWLRALAVWVEHVGTRADDRWLGFDWAAAALRPARGLAQEAVTAVADLFITAARPINQGAAADLRWTFEQAEAAALRWHAALARERNERGYYRSQGVPVDQAVDYAPLPNAPIVRPPYEIVPLRSGRELHEEGAAMHHCVGSYSGDVLSGRSRIYSLRRDGRRIVTIELGGDLNGRPRLRQVRGPCNAPPGVEAMAAARWLEREAQQCCPPGDGFPFRRGAQPYTMGEVTLRIGEQVLHTRGVMRVMGRDGGGIV